MKAQTLLMKAREGRVAALSFLNDNLRSTKAQPLNNTFRGRRIDHLGPVEDRLFAYLQFLDRAA